MDVHELRPVEIPPWIALRAELWPEQPREQLEIEGRAALAAQPPLVVFVAATAIELAGFIEISLRSYAEGCEGSPVPYIEGWYVRPGYRRQGIGAALLEAGIHWSRSKGFTEMGSDANAANLLSHAVHEALGFNEVERLVIFRKPL